MRNPVARARILQKGGTHIRTKSGQGAQVQKGCVR